MTQRLHPGVLALAGLCLASAAAQAQPARDPDWPCFQRKVPELSVAAVWTGPAIDAALPRWSADADVKALVERVAQRRMPVEDASAAVAAFAEAQPEAGRTEKLTLLFAGLFETLDRERDTVMEGIDRYGRRQKGLAEKIRADAAQAGAPGAAADPKQVEQASNQLVWETRIFNERRASLTYVCEVPTLIEQRLFALGRAIAAQLPKAS